MTAETNIQFESMDAANQYVGNVREHYRQDHASYAGRRDGDQQAIAELASEEASILVDGVMAGILAVNASGVKATELPSKPVNYEDIEVAGHKWSDFRGEFERLLVGFGVISNRLHREGYDVPDYLELEEADRIKAASVLFGDFLALNGLRFGVDGSGVKSGFTRHTEDGGIERVVRDKDKEPSDRMIRQNMAQRGYSSGIATHIAGKMSPDDYKNLRKEFPEIDKDRFDAEAGGLRNAAEGFALRGE